MPFQSDSTSAHEISFIDVLLFLKASVRNLVVSITTYLLLGAFYYFSVPNVYEATATIQLATVAGELVEAPAVSLEKIKLPLFFSTAAMQACGTDEQPSSQSKFVDKLKPTLNKSVPLITFTAQARSAKDARDCLDAVIGEIQQSQNELARPLIEQKKQKLAQLGDQLKFSEDIVKSVPAAKARGKLMDTQFSRRVLAMTISSAIEIELNDLRKQINVLENELLPPQTVPTSLSAPVYAPESPINNRPLLILGISLALGIFFGLVVTGVMRVLPEIQKQIRAGEMQ